MIFHTPNGYKVYGKEFTFKGPRKGRDANYRDQRRAYAEAQAEKARVESALIEQAKAAGREPPSKREMSQGYLNVSEPVKSREERVADGVAKAIADTKAREKAYDERNVARELLNSNTRAARNQRDKLQKEADEFDAKLAAKKAKEAFDANGLIRNAREHAEASFRIAQRNPKATPEEVQTRRKLLDFIASANGDAEAVNAAYWRDADKAAEDEYARLDVAAAAVQATAAAAKAEADAVRADIQADAKRREEYARLGAEKTN